MDPYPKNPLLVLREHIVLSDFRVIDLLQKADTDCLLSVTPEQFAAALEVQCCPHNAKALLRGSFGNRQLKHQTLLGT